MEAAGGVNRNQPNSADGGRHSCWVVDVVPPSYIRPWTGRGEQKEVGDVSTHTLSPTTSAGPGTVKFLVLRQDQKTRAYRWLGLLCRHDGEYHFRYTAEAAADPELRPLPGFPDLGKEYRSNGLFATFANRVITPRRDSYDGIRTALNHRLVA